MKELPDHHGDRVAMPARLSKVGARSVLSTNCSREPGAMPGPTTTSGTLASESYGEPLPVFSWCWPRWNPLSDVSTKYVSGGAIARRRVIIRSIDCAIRARSRYLRSAAWSVSVIAFVRQAGAGETVPSAFR